MPPPSRRLAAQIASGEALVVLAHQERRRATSWKCAKQKPRKRPGGYVLNATKSVVPAGDQADAFIVPAKRQ
jgi:alkylation response protein AidB-like acyl-CoA dehydrogenase